jgi:putative ABC transport system permease protein
MGRILFWLARTALPFPQNSLAQVESVLAGHGVVAPFALVVARTGDGQAVVVVGADFERVRQLDRWWSVSNWPSAGPTPGQAQGGLSRATDAREMGHQALVGVRALRWFRRRISPSISPFKDAPFTSPLPERCRQGLLKIAGSIFLLTDFMAWTGVQPSTIEVAASGSPEEINGDHATTGAGDSGGRCASGAADYGRRSSRAGQDSRYLLAAAALIILTAALCVLSTLMGWVFDRRRDFAIMKALGASDRLLNGFFAAEAAALGATGAMIGFVLGIGIAAWIGRVNFHAAVVPRFSCAAVCAGW